MQEFTQLFDKILRLDNFFYEDRKYKILEIINSKPADISRTIKKELPKCLQISVQTFSNWLNANKTDILEIPSLKLAIIAKSLNVSIEALINVEVPSFNFSLPANKLKNEIISKSGLTI
jgi:hypothetical protein